MQQTSRMTPWLRGSCPTFRCLPIPCPLSLLLLLLLLVVVMVVFLRRVQPRIQDPHRDQALKSDSHSRMRYAQQGGRILH
jgi:hypothetical protein